jgi:hypothetical protein
MSNLLKEFVAATFRKKNEVFPANVARRICSFKTQEQSTKQRNGGGDAISRGSTLEKQ